MSNRILAYLSRPCPCCSELRQIERQLDRAAIEAERIEALAGGVFEYWIPDASRVLKPRPDDEDDVGVRIVLLTESRSAGLDEDLRAFTIAELRGLAAELIAAADRIGGGTCL